MSNPDPIKVALDAVSDSAARMRSDREVAIDLLSDHWLRLIGDDLPWRDDDSLESIVRLFLEAIKSSW